MKGDKRRVWKRMGNIEGINWPYGITYIFHYARKWDIHLGKQLHL